MPNPLKARLPCLEHGEMEGHPFVMPTSEAPYVGANDWCPGGREVLLVPTKSDEQEKAIAVVLRREWPNLLPSTDKWRPIVKRALVLLAAAVGDTWTIEEKDE